MAPKPAGKKPDQSKATKKPAPRKVVAGKVAGKTSKPPPKKVAAKKAIKLVPVATPTPRQLTAKEERFVQEYLADLNATQAAIRAGYSQKTARQIGAENLSKPVIQAAIAVAQAERARRTEITADRALREAWSIATGDARELVQVKVGCCRYCHGESFRLQRTVGEMNRDREAHAIAGKTPDTFDEMGGIGFDPLAAPNEACTECGGDGLARVVLSDTRHLSEQAAALYAGAKVGKHGIEIQLHSKDAALEKVFKHLGLYREDNSQKVDALASLLYGISGGNSSAFQPVKSDPERDTKG